MEFVSNEPQLTFEDVLLVPQYSEVSSRSQVDTSVMIGGLQLFSPIISACMDTVTELDMAVAMDEAGGLGILHRFMSTEDQAAQVASFRELGGKNIGAAIGVKDEDLLRAYSLAEAGVDILCLDIAHAHTNSVAKFLGKLEGWNIPVIVGNVATAAGAAFLIDHGAAAVKCGIGSSGICATRMVAGTGIPQLSAILNCAAECQNAGIPLIADGGITGPGDVAKAIAAGASAVMVGNLLARSIEAPGTVVYKDGKPYKVYRGMASKSAMKSRRSLDSGNTKVDTTPEGVEALVELEGTATDKVAELVGGLRSACSYSNAFTLEQFQDNAQFVTISNSSIRESGIYGVSSVL